jgi:hypothetical protein
VVSLRGESADPSGDGGVADLVFASFEVIGSNIRVRAELSPDTFHRDSILVEFDLDTDENAATGYTTPNPGHVGIGIDCLIELGKVAPANLGVRVRRFEAGSFVSTVVAAATPLTNGYEATVPLSGCADDGRALLRVGSFRQVGNLGGTTVRQDWLPDPPGVPIAVR